MKNQKWKNEGKKNKKYNISNTTLPAHWVLKLFVIQSNFDMI